MTATRCVGLAWNPAFRVIPTRFPATNLFDCVAGAQDFDALHALDAMTSARLRDELGEISLVPPEERLYGPGSGPIMAAFTHPNPAGSRFSDGRDGLFYCARDRQTAIAEACHHQGLFMAATRTGIVRNCLHAAYLKHNRDGRASDAVFEVSQPE